MKTLNLPLILILGMSALSCAPAPSVPSSSATLCDEDGMTKAKNNSGAVSADIDAITEILLGFPTIREAGQNLSELNRTEPTLNGLKTPPC